MTATLSPPAPVTPATTMTTRELFERLGDVPLFRVCIDPEPGKATEADLLEIRARTKRLFELVDGILVEKAMGLPASFLAAVLIRLLGNWVSPRNLGAILAPDGMLRLRPGLVRIPDVSFIPWDRFPGRQIDLNVPIPALFPDLAIEVLSPSNTPSEMAVKRQEYFTAGTRLVWIVDPGARTVEVFTSPTASTLLHEADTLDGGAVLPGFSLPLAQLFAELDPH
jgi:Uma2 family endonuclease